MAPTPRTRKIRSRLRSRPHWRRRQRPHRRHGPSRNRRRQSTRPRRRPRGLPIHPRKIKSALRSQAKWRMGNRAPARLRKSAPNTLTDRMERFRHPARSQRSSRRHTRSRQTGQRPGSRRPAPRRANLRKSPRAAHPLERHVGTTHQQRSRHGTKNHRRENSLRHKCSIASRSRSHRHAPAADARRALEASQRKNARRHRPSRKKTLLHRGLSLSLGTRPPRPFHRVGCRPGAIPRRRRPRKSGDRRRGTGCSLRSPRRPHPPPASYARKNKIRKALGRPHPLPRFLEAGLRLAPAKRRKRLHTQRRRIKQRRRASQRNNSRRLRRPRRGTLLLPGKLGRRSPARPPSTAELERAPALRGNHAANFRDAPASPLLPLSSGISLGHIPVRAPSPAQPWFSRRPAVSQRWLRFLDDDRLARRGGHERLSHRRRASPSHAQAAQLVR